MSKAELPGKVCLQVRRKDVTRNTLTQRHKNKDLNNIYYQRFLLGRKFNTELLSLVYFGHFLIMSKFKLIFWPTLVTFVYHSFCPDQK